MKVVALISGGKDSCYNMMHCVAMGHQIVALANLHPSGTTGESDSYMYQTVGSEAIQVYAEAMQLPLFRREIQGSSNEIDLTYHVNDDDEVEDLYHLLKSIKEDINFEAVSCGAILSDYQRIRVENVCSRLNLVSLAYLWRRDQAQLLKEMIGNQLVAILIKTAALGLAPKTHLGKTLQEMEDHLAMLNQKYGSHICGEGGEYETFVLDCPLFKKRIVIDDSEIIIHADDGVVTVAYLRLASVHLEEKEKNGCIDLSNLVLNHLDAMRVEDDQESTHHINLKTSWKWKNESQSFKIECYDDLLSTCALGTYLSISNLFGLCSTSNEEDITNCTRKSFAKLTELLEEHDHSLSDVVVVYLCLADMSHFGVINSVYKTYFNLNPPARVCISPLIKNGCQASGHSILFQMDCVSCKENRSVPKKIMHVQGISHWAPANIGPYSQCAMVGNLYFVAGQIGLVPGTMTIIEGGIAKQAAVSLQHGRNILTAMDSSLDLQNTVQCVCYITQEESLNTVRSIWENAVQENDDLLKRVVYITINSLPRNALVEWQVTALKSPDEHATQVLTLFNDSSENLDMTNEVKLLLVRFLSLRVDQENESQCKPLHIRIFYAKQNLSIGTIQDVHQTLKEGFAKLPSISWIPVKSVFSHSNTTCPSLALNVLFITSS